MSEGERQIIQLLTELRDAQREELAYRRRMLDESMDLQRRALSRQRVAMVILPVLVLAFGSIVGLLLIALRVVALPGR